MRHFSLGSCAVVAVTILLGISQAKAETPGDRSDGCIGFIGDSITFGEGAKVSSGQGEGQLGATDAVGWIRTWLPAAGAATGRKLIVNNRAVLGATTNDFLGANAGYYFNAISGWPHMGYGFQGGHCIAIMVTLGTNDSRDVYAFPPAQYRANLETLIANIKHDLPNAKIILNAPPWYDGDRAGKVVGNGYGPASAARLATYLPVLSELADNKTVFLGDVDSYARFKASANATGPAALLGDDGLHPNDTGYRVIAHGWFEALRTVLHLPAPQPLH